MSCRVYLKIGFGWVWVGFSRLVSLDRVYHPYVDGGAVPSIHFQDTRSYILVRYRAIIEGDLIVR
jgi:hypothetical protein